MKFERIICIVVAAWLATGCSGSVEETTLPAVSQPSIAPTMSTVSTTTSAPTTTAERAAPTTSTPDQLPESLAFGSSKDIGRLFEVVGERQLRIAGDGEATENVADGTFVQALSMRKVDGELWVQVRSVGGETSHLGWLVAGALMPTERYVVTVESEFENQFRITAPVLPDGELDVVSSPGGKDVVGVLGTSEVALYGGTNALAADGANWVDVLDVDTGNIIGWVPERFFAALPSAQAKNADGRDVGRFPDSAISYGAGLANGTITEGCNADQITFRSLNDDLGTAIVFGRSIPSGRSTGSTVVWRSERGGSVYVAPGDDVTFTLPREPGESTWYFTQLDANLQAAVATSPSPGGDPLAAFVQTFTVPAGTCLPPERPEVNDPLGEEAATLDERVANEAQVDPQADESDSTEQGTAGDDQEAVENVQLVDDGSEPAETDPVE